MDSELSREDFKKIITGTEPEHTTILSMLSGGIDSTSMTYRFLTQPEYADYDIHIHYTEMLNREKRWYAENYAVSKCIDWFKKNCREFKFTRSTMDFSFIPRKFPMDADVNCFVASQIVRSQFKKYKFIGLGMTRTDFSRTSDMNTISKQSQNIIDACLTNSKSKVEKIYPVVEFSKKKLWDSLPEELKYLTWSCRKPVYNEDYTSWKPCCKCKSCNERRFAGIDLFKTNEIHNNYGTFLIDDENYQFPNLTPLDKNVTIYPNDIVHIGAGYGEFLPILSRMTKGDVWAFEDNPQKHYCAEKCINANQLRNVVVLEFDVVNGARLDRCVPTERPISLIHINDENFKLDGATDLIGKYNPAIERSLQCMIQNIGNL